MSTTQCAVCGGSGGIFQRATYTGAPDGGVPVHTDCLDEFYDKLDGIESATADEITVLDVFRALKIEPLPKVTWAVGNAVRDLFMHRNHGKLPPKKLHRKTNARGSHCFATYPRDYFSDIEHFIRQHEIESQRQGDLF